jgi:hypothetical protein
MDRMLEKIIPNEVSSIDGAVMVSILSKTADFVVDLHNIENDRTKFEKSRNDSYSYDLFCISSSISCDFTIDDDGRIIRLSINGGRRERFALPEIIARLERLTDLTLGHCQSIPMELSNLPQLKALTLIHCSDLFDNSLPVQMVLSKLKEFSICNYRSESTPMSTSTSTSTQLIAWMSKQLPILEELGFFFLQKNRTDSVLNALSTVKYLCFQYTLKSLTMERCSIDQKSFETLWFDVRPKFPKMSALNLHNNRIESIQPTVERIKNDDITIISKSLQVLDLSSNPITKLLKDDPIENAAMLSFLESYNAIYSFGIGNYDANRQAYVCDYGSNIEYALRTNHAGRSIVEGDDRKDDRPLVPLSLWPTILERAYKKSDCTNYAKNATGLNYLVREVGPALICRCIALRAQSNNGGGDEGHGNNNDNNDIKKCKDSTSVLKGGERKRKRNLVDE